MGVSVTTDLTGAEPNGLGVGSGQTNPVPAKRPGALGVLSVKITDTATVTVQGRASPDDDWKEIVTRTSSDALRIAILPELRLDYDVTAGTLAAWITEPDR